jgi:hypothetical protein
MYERDEIHRGLKLAEGDFSWETRKFEVSDVIIHALQSIVVWCYIGGAVQVESS